VSEEGAVPDPKRPGEEEQDRQQDEAPSSAKKEDGVRNDVISAQDFEEKKNIKPGR